MFEGDKEEDFKWFQWSCFRNYRSLASLQLKFYEVKKIKYNFLPCPWLYFRLIPACNWKIITEGKSACLLPSRFSMQKSYDDDETAEYLSMHECTSILITKVFPKNDIKENCNPDNVSWICQSIESALLERFKSFQFQSFETWKQMMNKLSHHWKKILGYDEIDGTTKLFNLARTFSSRSKTRYYFHVAMFRSCDEFNLCSNTFFYSTIALMPCLWRATWFRIESGKFIFFYYDFLS